MSATGDRGRRLASARHGSPVRTGLRGWAGSSRPSNLIRVMPAQGGSQRMELGRLHVIIDVAPGRDWLELSRAVLDAGAPVLQLRAKTATDREAFEMAWALRPLCADAGAMLVVDDRIHVAM